MSEAGDVDPPRPKGGQEDVLDADEECISVDAGAGSGKTTTMRWRIERMLNVADPPLSSRVLVLTFANEAAAAIQKSIRQADDLTIDQAYNVDVYTYHSFCSQLVSEYAYVAGLDPDFDVITEEQRQRIIQSLIEDNDYLYVSRRQGDVDAVVREAVKYVREMRQEAVSPEHVDGLLPDRSAIGVLKRMVIELEQEAARLFNPDEHRFIIWDDFEIDPESIVANLEEYRETVEKWQRVSGRQPEDIWKAVDAYLHFLDLWIDTVDELVEVDTAPALGFFPQAVFGDDIHSHWWTDLKQTPFGHLKSYVEALEEIHGLQDIYLDYVEALDERGALDFDELINRAHTLIHDSPVQEEIKGRWDYVFCDEFQDTDDVQLDVVTGLCRDGGAQLLAIGDVDQAIYGWRGANPEGLTELGEAFDDHEEIRINRNFRSQQEILDLVNECGVYDSKRLVSDECDIETPGGEPMVERSDDDEARLGLVNGDWTGLTPAEEVATTISQLLEGGFSDISERTLGDIAVLVRTNKQARNVAAQLRNRQIPYQIDGTRESDLQPGVQTVLSYFRTLADPAADIHLRRMLMLVYRVPADDLRALETADADSLYEAVMDFDGLGLSLDEPDRVERAGQDIEELAALKDRHSLPTFYRMFLEKTHIKWYLQEKDRAQLDRIMKFIQGYESDNVLRRFSEEFVDDLARSLRGRDEDVGVRIGSHASDKINIMTVHQAKGLQFDTVLFPYLEDEEWVSMNCPGWASTSCATWKAHRYKSIIQSLKSEEFTHALAESTYSEQQREDWRTFHVGATRAESLLVAFSQSPEGLRDHQQQVRYLRQLFAGSSSEYRSPEQLVRAAFPDVDTPWSPEYPQMRLWHHLREAFLAVKDRYPETVVDLSDEVDQAASRTLGEITYWAEYDHELELEDAIEDIHGLGERMLDGDLTAVDPRRHSVYPVSLGFDDATELPVTHSHTSLETFSDCSLRHLLDHVLYGFDDPIPAEAEIGRSDTPSWRKVGNVFHAVAEEAFYRSNSEEAEWMDICDRVIRARDVGSVRDAVEECIRRFFRTDVAEWEAVAAELPFELTGVPGVEGPIVGFMDSVRRVPGQGLTVLDYKTTFEKRDIESSSQLLLYLRACEELFDEPVEWAGYVYVGVAGADDGAVEMIHRDDLEEEWDEVVKLLQAADTPSWDPEPGDHCEFCPHRSLGCAPEEYVYHNEYVIDPSRHT